MDNLDQMSREQLMERAQLLAKARTLRGGQKTTPLPQQPGTQAMGNLPLGHPDNPDTANLFGADLARVKASFGNLAGVSPMVERQGFRNVKKNKQGELVAQWPTDGRWYKDAQGLSHPVNWLEGHAGGALPLAGMLTGGAVGGTAGGALGLESGPGAVATGYAGAVTGAGVGSAAGEGVRAKVGDVLGSYRGEASPSMLEAGKEGAAAEAIGRPVAAIPLPGLNMTLGEGAGKVVGKIVNPVLAKLSNLATFGTIDPAAAKRLLSRPDEVLSSMRGRKVLDVAQEGATELGARDRIEGNAISKGRQAFADKYGTNPVDTSHMVDALENFGERNRPNSYGQSAVPPEDFEEAASWMQSLDNGTGVTGQAGSEGPQAQQNAGSLQKTADYLQNLNPGAYNKTGQTKFRSERIVGEGKQLAGKIKKALHEMSPELSLADERFSKYASASNLMKGIENPATAENYASNLFGKNKGAYQEAAQEYMPQTYEKMADIGAFKNFSKDPLQALGPSAPMIGRAAFPLVGGQIAGHFSSNPLAIGAGMAAGTGFSVGTSPLAWRLGLGTTGRVMNTQLPTAAISPWMDFHSATNRTPQSESSDLSDLTPAQRAEVERRLKQYEIQRIQMQEEVRKEREKAAQNKGASQ